MSVSEGSTRLADWDSPEAPATGSLVPLLLPAGAAAPVAVATALVSNLLLGLVVFFVLAGIGSGWMLTRGRAFLARLGARPIAAGEQPRLENLASGLSDDLDLSPPSLWLIPNDKPNAAVVWSGEAHLAVTSGLLEKCPLTQLEAVVAHCLVRVAAGEAKRATLALSWGPLASTLVRVGFALDTRTAALTRYPPALAAAVRLCEPVSGDPVWFVGRGPCFAGREDRAAALGDL